MSKPKEKHFGTYIDRNYRIIRLRFLQAFKECGVDITTEQWVILDSLYHHEGLSQTELAAMSFKDAPTTSRIIDHLCQKGFASRIRSETDRRAVVVNITDKGKTTYEHLLPSVKDLRQIGWEGLSEEDYESFLRIMNQVFKNFGS
ncbi:MAG: MarR family transcriptional regulator [Saprospiraceae bacterium]|nr:MarR family transcriptional regulator [Saprospiraceae bacterium]